MVEIQVRSNLQSIYSPYAVEATLMKPGEKALGPSRRKTRPGSDLVSN